jgi:hypothetical protein
METAIDRKDKKDMSDPVSPEGTKDVGGAKKGRFEFAINDLYRPDSSLKVIRSVRFRASCFGNHTHTLTFGSATTQLDTLEAVRTYLDQPIERAYFDAVADDLGAQRIWDTLSEEGFACRGDLLGDHIFYDGFEAREGLEGAYDLLLGS